MKIALVSPSFAPTVGGIERFTEELAGWLTATGHDVTVITATVDRGDADRSRPYRVARGLPAAAVVRLLRAADVVHTKSLSVRAVALARAAGRRPVVTHGGHQAICPVGIAWGTGGVCTASGERPGPCRSCPRRDARGWATIRAQRAAAAAAAVNVAVSDYLDRRLAVPRSVRIYNPIASTVFDPAPVGGGEDGLIAFAGRLGEAKGLDVLIEAVARRGDVRLEVAGDGPARSRCQALAGELGAAGRVRFLGAVPPEAVFDLYKRASLVCVPTLCEEAFGYAAAEAMAVGRAVVVTPSGALPELVDDERGYVAATGDLDGLAAALAAALHDPGERARRAARGRAFAERHFHADSVGARYVDQYERVE